MDLQTLDLAVLPDAPVVNGYEWTGSIGGHDCVLFGDRELAWDKGRKTMMLDTRSWTHEAGGATLGRARRFHERIGVAGEPFLACVYADIGTGTLANGQHQAKRGGWKFTGLFEVVERGDLWVRASMRRRSGTARRV